MTWSRRRQRCILPALAVAMIVSSVGPAGADVTPGNGPAAGGTAVTGTVTGAAFTQLSVGYDNVVALDRFGQAYTWGEGYWGNLGNGTSGGLAESAVPVKVTQGDLRFTKVSAGYLHMLALTDDGKVYAWGYGGSGRLGDGGTAYRTTPVQAVAPGVTFKDISAGAGHSLALASDGRAWAWGDNNYRQLGRAGSGVSVPTVISGSPSFVELGATPDAESSFGITAAGVGYAWGRNFSGQLGIGTVTQPDPGTSTGGVVTPTAMEGGPYVEIYSVGNRTTMLTTGGVVTSAGQQPTGTDAPTPVTVDTGALRFRSISGYGHVIGLGTDGRVYTWGSNEDGERGDGTYRTPYNATIHQVTDDGSPVRATQVYAGRNFSVVNNSTTGQVLGWGNGFTGQLGDGLEDRQPSPVLGPHWRVTAAAFGGAPATDVSGTATTWSATTPAAAAEGTVDVRVQATLYAGPTATSSTLDLPAGQYKYGTLPPSATRLAVSGRRVAGQPVTLTATVAPAVAGVVEFRDGSKLLRSVAVSSGRASYDVKLAAGSHAITARFVPANGVAAPSTSTRVTVAIAKAKPTLTVRAPRQVDVGESAVVTVVVRAAGLVATGRVTVSVAGRTASGALRNGKAVLTVKNLVRVGRRQKVTVAYAGTSQIAGAQDSRTTLDVVP